MSKKIDKEFVTLWSERLTHMLVLGFLGVIFSLPVFTVGASMSAMHKAMMLYVVQEDKKIFRNYFSAFKTYFKQSTLIWIINLVLILVLSFDLLFYGESSSWIQILGTTIVTISLMVIVYEMTMSFVIVPAELTQEVKQTIIISLHFGLKCPYYALMMLILHLVIPGLLILFMVPILVFVPGILSYLSWQFLPKAFEYYQKKCL